MRNSKKKQSFLLLELLIAISLLSLCVLPLVQLPFNALNAEIKNYQRMQLKRLADLGFAQIEAQLFQNAIAWEDLSTTRDKKTLLAKEIQTVHLKRIGDKKFEKNSLIWTSRRKERKNQGNYRLVTIEQTFKSLSDRHFF